MKKQILLLTILVFSASILFAQNRIPRHSKMHLQNHAFTKHKVNEDNKTDRLLKVKDADSKTQKPFIIKDVKSSVWAIDSSYYYEWDSELSNMVLYVKGVFSYDSNGNATEVIWYSWDSGLNGWVEECKERYSYDLNGNNIEYIVYDWDSGLSDWVGYYKEVSTHDANGNLLEHLCYSWDSELSSWVVDDKEVYTYDANGNNTERIDYDWNSGNWVKSSKEEYSFNNNDNLTETVYYSWDTGLNDWKAGGRDTCSYDVNGNLTEILTYQRAPGEKAEINWVVSWKKVYSYDSNGNNTEWISYTWSSEAWLGIEKYIYTYDSNGNMTEEVEYDWDSGHNTWLGIEKNIYTYDSNGNMTEEVYYEWDSGTSDWVESCKEVYFWSQLQDNHPPSDIILRNGKFDENNALNVIIDTIDVIDEDGNNNHTITFVDEEGNDNSDFTLEGNVLKTSIVFNYENKKTYSLKFQAEDTEGDTIQKELSFQITDLNESPEVNDSILDQITREDEVFSFTISDTVFKDPDAGDILEYSASLSDESSIPAWLTFNSSTRTFSGTPADMDLKSIRVIAEDSEGLNVYDDFILVVEGYDEVTEEEITIDTTSSEDVVTVTVPEQLFIDMGLGDDIEYTASLADGSPLPSYIVFDPETLIFTITLNGKTSYKEILAELDILVTGVDSDGYTATIGFIIEGTFLSDNINIFVNLKVYPNPVKDKLIIEIPGNFKVKTIEIYSVLGQKLAEFKMPSERIEIDFSSFKTSIYIIKIVNEEESKALRIIKQ